MKRAVLVAVLLAAAGPAPGQDDPDREPFYGSIDLSSLDATRERPLFSPSRRPPAPPPAPPPRPAPVAATLPMLPPEPPPLRLIGLVTMGETHMALVEDGNTGEILRLSPGAAIAGWTMEILDDRTIAFSRDGDAAHFALFAK